VVIGIDYIGSNNFQMSEERSYICVLGVSILCLFCTIFLIDFGTVLTVCYYFVFHFTAVTFSEVMVIVLGVLILSLFLRFRFRIIRFWNCFDGVILFSFPFNYCNFEMEKQH